ncbi:hypothetical protein GHT06_021751 [Daphnia sinensis]|uniref:Secreted protein n=1 Tax=Daphnia sinensis TaxID=1820382 RepID=A0AAD5L5J6_9CRUS|nr:hypothetical protein GHT06_021751 [Daphnia sinensis]
MKCGFDCFHALFVLLALLTPGSHSTKLYLDEVLADVIEKLFGAVVQDEFTELIDNCPDASTSLKRTADCITDRNLSYERFSPASPDTIYVKQICDDLSAVGKCFESVIKALESCSSSGGGREIQKKNMNAVNAGLNAGLDYFCKDGGSKLNAFFKQGLPQCFIRRPGRHLARCFPGRRAGQASDSHRNINYWGTMAEENDFFNAHNCLLLRNHTNCAVGTLQKCSKNGVDVFQGAIDTVMEHLMCVDGKPETQENSEMAAVGAIHPVFLSIMSALVCVEFHRWLLAKSF